MAEETITILRVGTEEAVKSVNDLKENIKLLKKSLGDLEIGTEEYQETLEELVINQNALKDAMHATTASMEDVAAAATGASQSYNSLVHQMAALKEEWRATNDEARRNELGKQISEINQQLKEMDASVGNFQRNVGNYESGTSKLVAKFDEWGGLLQQMPPTLGSAKQAMGDLGETMQLLGKQPILGIVGLLAPIIIKITESLKENETAMAAVKRLMESLQPVFDVLSGVVDGIAKGFAIAVDWLVQFVGEADGIKKVITSIAGVGNAIIQHITIPVKVAIETFKGLGKIIGDVFKGDWSEIKNHAKETGQGIAEAYKEGFSYKSNFEVGKAKGAEFIDGVKNNEEKARQAGKELAASVQEGYDEELERIKAENAEDAEIQAALAAEEQDILGYQASLEAQEEFQKQQEESLWNHVGATLEAKLAAKQEEEDIERAKAEQEIAIAKARVDAEIALQKKLDEERKEKLEKAKLLLSGFADATSSILGSIAEMYEADEKNAEKNSKKIKALRIAEATINTISGAIGAFTQANATMPPPIGAIVGAAQAAAVTAAGIAQINQIRNTNVSASGGGAAAAPSAPGAMVSAPPVETGLASVRNITTASEEERLNQMAKDQRVYIVSSDIEAALGDSKTRVSESSF